MIRKENMQVVSRVKDWKEAIRLAAQPLLKNKKVSENYIEKMIENVLKMGPYIVISNDIAIPHARPEDGVFESDISILKLKERVEFTPDKHLNIIIVLAGSNNDSHIKYLKRVSEILSNKQNYQTLVDTVDIDVMNDLFNRKED